MIFGLFKKVTPEKLIDHASGLFEDKNNSAECPPLKPISITLLIDSSLTIFLKNSVCSLTCCE